MYKGYIRLDAVLKAYVVAQRTRAPRFDVWVVLGQVGSVGGDKAMEVRSVDVITYASALTVMDVVEDLFTRGYMVWHDSPIVNPVCDEQSDLEPSFWMPFGRLFLLDENNRGKCPYFRKATFASCTVWEHWKPRRIVQEYSDKEE
jgi:hypothetical protein